MPDHSIADLLTALRLSRERAGASIDYLNASAALRAALRDRELFRAALREIATPEKFHREGWIDYTHAWHILRAEFTRGGAPRNCRQWQRREIERYLDDLAHDPASGIVPDPHGDAGVYFRRADPAP